MVDDREPLGRVAHETEVAYWAEQGVTIYPWEAWEQKELAMRVGSAVAARAVHDAGLVNDRRDAQLFALSAHLPAVLDALRAAEKRAVVLGTGSAGKRYRAALEALGGSDEKDRKP